MNYQHFYTPTDYTTITPDMVRRWMALEQRLDEMQAYIQSGNTGDSQELLDTLNDVLEYVKDGKE